MIGWLKELSRKQSRKNISRLLPKLIEAANAADATIVARGAATPAERELVKRLQNEFLIELCGPLRPTEVRTEMVDPALESPRVSKGARMAIDHVFDTVKAKLGPDA